VTAIPVVIAGKKSFRDYFYRKNPNGKKVQVERETGISKKVVDKIFSDDQFIRSDMIVRLCSAYDLRIEEAVKIISDDKQ